MKTPLVVLSIGLSLLAAAVVFADSTIEVVSTFDYPKAQAHRTFSNGIANNGNLVGVFYVDTHGRLSHFGFELFSNGRFGRPLSFPGSTATDAADINDAGLICGSFATSASHGFFYDGRSYTQFDAPGAASTYLAGVNDNGDFVGTLTRALPPFFDAFVDLGGVYTTMSIPNSESVAPSDINNLREIAGSYFTSAPSKLSAFFRAADGSLVAPIYFPGANGTAFYGINDDGWMAGEWTDKSGTHHGLLFHLPSEFISFDYPGAKQTGFHGFNNAGTISGYAIDNSGYHGFTAQFQP